MIVIVDYKLNNLQSIYNAVNICTSKKVIISDNPLEIEQATHIILPGIGTYNSGMNNLLKYNLIQIIQKKAKDDIPILGICLGMQLLSEYGNEGSKGCKIFGLGLIEGYVDKINLSNNKLPHIGWNNIIIKNNSSILNNVIDNSDQYFIHSYCFYPQKNDSILSETNYMNIIFPSIIKHPTKNIYGCQFHPEKSGKIGIQILKNFVNL